MAWLAILADELPGLPVGMDSELFHTTLHTLTIVLLVYLVRSSTRR